MNPNFPAGAFVLAAAPLTPPCHVCHAPDVAVCGVRVGETIPMGEIMGGGYRVRECLACAACLHDFLRAGRSVSVLDARRQWLDCRGCGEVRDA